MRTQLCALAAVVACALTGAAPAVADQRPPALDWHACGTAAGVVCSTISVPRDYQRPRAGSFQLMVAKSPATDPAHRIGTLFVNFGGPGAPAAATFEALGAARYPALNARYDIVAIDPRGVGESQPAIDCQANQETDGITAQPFTTPDNLNPGALIAKDTRYINRCLALNRHVLRYVSTAGVARDMDLVRRALGERQISYLGFSYGTFLGATYASMFPANYRAMVLDGPVDADAYINDPMRQLSAQSDAFERSLGRFLAACARDQAACHGFGGTDPWDAYDQLIDRLDHQPLPTADGRTVDGDDALAGTQLALYAKENWPFLGQALEDLENGKPARMRLAADLGYGRNPDGTYSPFIDRYFTIGAAEQDYAHNPRLYLQAGRRSWDEHEHFWWNNGYLELNYGLYPVHAADVFRGPFRISRSSATPLVVATTYDPATPYRGALNLVRDLGNARLLTMRGDGHGAYNGESACVDAAVDAYLLDDTLPAAGTQCRQDVGFGAPQVRANALTAPVSGLLLRRVPSTPVF